MKIYVQWTLATPQDWELYDSSDWRNLPKKPEPVGGEIIDDQPGWIHGLCIQGVVFNSFDHYALWESTDPVGLVVGCWNDDPVDYPVGTRFGDFWMFEPIQPDSAIGGQLNTRQTKVTYGDPEWIADKDHINSIKMTGGLARVDLWNRKPNPATPIIKHGIWVSDALNDEHFAVRSVHGWHEWIE